MIKSFRCNQTEALWDGGKVAKWLRPIETRAIAKLMMLDGAAMLNDLRVPPENRLEAGDRAGQAIEAEIRPHAA